MKVVTLRDIPNVPVEGADRIIVLDQGRIAETGSHQELLARGGLYAALHGMQFNA